jgi:deoxyribodipyrimidine photo-lyase
MNTDMRPAIVWFRNDLRASDNQALSEAVAAGLPVICLYIFDEEGGGARKIGAAQRWWLHHSLLSLGERLATSGARLILRRGAPGEVLDEIISASGAARVYWNRRHEPKSIDHDTKLKSDLLSRGISVESFAGQLLHEPTRLKTGAGGFFKVYTPFWRAFSALPEPLAPFDAPERIQSFGGMIESDDLDDWALLPTHPDWAKGFAGQWTPGESGAAAALDAFLDNGLSDYADGRNIPGAALTSRLSPHLALGEISPFQIWHSTRGRATDPATRSTETFRKELVWREFAYHLLYNFPDLAIANFNASFTHFPWSPQPEHERAWKEGRTGYPIVDAGMRQLWQTGWMHNRVRMITASFLIKHLMIDWRVGEDWFWDTLVDACPANNPAGWQWVAGSGADAAPYYRIFNPTLQGEKFDTDGAYVRRYVPELAGLPDALIHRPWEASDAQLASANIVLGKTYPRPIVDHSKARDRALTAYQDMKGAAA